MTTAEDRVRATLTADPATYQRLVAVVRQSDLAAILELVAQLRAELAALRVVAQ